MAKRIIFEESTLRLNPVNSGEKSLVMWNIIRTIMYNCSPCYCLFIEPSDITVIDKSNSLFITKQLFATTLEHVKISQNVTTKNVGKMVNVSINTDMRVSDITFNPELNLTYNDNVLWEIDNYKVSGFTNVIINIPKISTVNRPGRQVIAFMVDIVDDKLIVTFTNTGQSDPKELLINTLTKYDTNNVYVKQKIDLYNTAYGTFAKDIKIIIDSLNK